MNPVATSFLLAIISICLSIINRCWVGSGCINISTSSYCHSIVSCSIIYVDVLTLHDYVMPPWGLSWLFNSFGKIDMYYRRTFMSLIIILSDTNSDIIGIVGEVKVIQKVFNLLNLQSFLGSAFMLGNQCFWW